MELDCFETEHTRNEIDGIQDLPNNGSPGSTSYPPMTHKNENRVKDDVSNAADQQTSHTCLWSTVRTDDTAEARVDHGKGESQNNDASVFQRIRQGGVSRPKQAAKGFQENFKEYQ